MGVSYTLDVTLPGLPRINSARGVHWRAKVAERKRWLWALKAFIPAKRRPTAPLEHARVVLTRMSTHEPDFDNLAESFKIPLDMLTVAHGRGLGILLDDSPRHIEVEYRWVKAKRGKGAVRIEVSE